MNAPLSYDYPFDTCQLPLNCFDASFRSFEQKVLPELNRRGIGAIGMKSITGRLTAPSVKEVISVAEALRYAMSLPVTTTVSGMNSLEMLRQNVQTASSFTPMTQAEMQALRAHCLRYAADGRFEL